MLRFAPSPTGHLHIGNARVAILNYLFAKKKNIDFFLRIDDTDTDRSRDEFVESIINDLKWLGISYGSVFKQSERKAKYAEIFDFLKNNEYIYPCFESKDELSLKRKIQLKMGNPPIYDRAALALNKKDISKLISDGIKPHWRLKLDEDPIKWNDEIHGLISFDNLSVSDPVVFRSDKLPLFTITSVVDDIELGVTHILRGDDHITNTAAQIKLFKYLKAPIPVFGHFPLMRSKTGEGLSKRLNSLSLRDLKKNKIFPEVIINYLCKIGSSESIDNIDTQKKLINKLDFQKFSKNSVLFNPDDIQRLNKKYIKTISYDQLENKDKKIIFDENFWNMIKLNIDSLGEADDWYERLKNKEIRFEKTKIEEELKNIFKEKLPTEINSKTWSDWTTKIIQEYEIKPKELYITLRMILTGKKYGPGMDKVLIFLSREEIIRRIEVNCEI